MVSALRVGTASLLLFGSSLFGCAPSADDPSSRLSTWEAPSGDFRIRYLSPPWELSDPDMPLFRIQSNANLAGGIDGGPGKFELRVMTQSGEVFALMADEVRRAGTTVPQPNRIHHQTM